MKDHRKAQQLPKCKMPFPHLMLLICYKHYGEETSVTAYGKREYNSLHSKDKESWQ